ncbi:hypothetical protein CLAFUW4_03882 [Fulvia fulva]|uniref:uncharacterized protein n=1 Tax=Passalora fulva TaxID=5499 RepID=UPI0004EA002F|nr:uncharacterized protein CLAFUR5_20167 [Fulvia fulva]KAK4631881.1 hypothetical protein CLAFUR4_03870 [Fulvia fulva]KAK4632561.1 hypothetical protein CLAFUR0_03869 [Fulvia fulva]WMI38810.1 hypothetical protein CLAFUR5_20167 [Fulvia fulva]WPV11039.1 hypothetical protein CLAFUW4_03882 [Fulvia fulva]WPV25412.1 hypothetical protein CLAFUW7_03874 [Fulvia fulva]
MPDTCGIFRFDKALAQQGEQHQASTMIAKCYTANAIGKPMAIVSQASDVPVFKR